MAHLEKYTAAATGHMLAHYDRTHSSSTSNIDESRIHLNYNLAETDQPLSCLDFLHKRISEIKVLKRANVNVMCDWVITAPEALTEEELPRFFSECYKFLNDRSAPVHMDETSPHIHYNFVPVVKDNHIDSDRLAALVNDIMDLTKLENGSTELHKEPFCVGSRLREIMTRYKLLSERDGYKFYVSTNEEAWGEADLIKFDQIIYNLVNNAVNYSGEEKSIYVMEVCTKKKITISVTDTGDGISKELMPLIFDRYYRAEKHKREVVGTGLGLSIVKQIFILHGFKFGVKSEVGIGSTFWFEMDRIEKPKDINM